MSQITVLGVGAMGSRMAANLLKAGHEVTVWNRSAEKTLPLVKAGARAAETPRSAVEKADFVISMVRDVEASRQVWLADEKGALDGMLPAAIALESSTLTVEWTRTLAQHFDGQNIAFLDAPVAGSLPQAEAAQLIYLVGGDAEIFNLAQPTLNVLGGAVHHAGAVGSGMAIKLAVNALFGIQAAAMGELIGFMQRCGLDDAQAVSILTATPVCSPAAKALAGAMIARKFAPLFPIELVEKDLRYLVASAQLNQAKVPIGESAQQVFNDALKQGYGTDHISGVAQLYF